MPFVPVENTCLVEIRMTADNQQVENTLWCEFPTAITGPDLVSLATDLTTWWGDNIQPIMWGGVTLREIVCTDMTSETGAQGSFSTATPTTGDLDEPPLPTGTSLAISFRTALRGRAFRGRNYAVGLVKSHTTGANTFTDALVSAYQAAYEALSAVITGAGFTWVIASRFSGVDAEGKPIPRAAGVTTPVTAVVITDNVVDSQRRRLPGRGN